MALNHCSGRFTGRLTGQTHHLRLGRHSDGHALPRHDGKGKARVGA